MTNHDDGWLTIREAAIQLGVSELTIRRRIKDGKVAHRLENGKYYIKFDEPVGTGRGRANPARQSGSSAAASENGGRAQVAPRNGVVEKDDVVMQRPPADSAGGTPRGYPANGATVPTDDGVATEGSATSSPPRPEWERGPGGEGSPLSQPLPVDLDALLGEHRRLAEKAGRGSVLAERVRELEAREAQLHDALVSLSNRNGWLESKLEEREHEVKLLTDGNRRVSWWRRLFGAPATG